MSAGAKLNRLVALVIYGDLLTEGQVARVIDCDRVTVRRMADEGFESLQDIPPSGEWGNSVMKQLVRDDR